ncbi:MAG: aminodeoxychorismate/anthranilate synthase component II [Candidatus Marinimicrobia bacterium]|nr:aminodeoxychorismate/anthranilate synthase component II [Candidatus Neomarinimicrobiota bacterium]MBT6871305.1 aminodeoxychorismate/anthranilate synthase component II [Candidatus Neomarinimicrobiota bacterium]
MILIIDNYDSFTYNLVQYIGTINPDLQVHRNDQISIDEIRRLYPEKIVISPGPGKPEDAGISIDVIKKFGGEIPILGICLGHQAITVAFGGKVGRANEIVHGKTSTIIHSGSEIFREIPSEFEATRYHSLVAEEDTFPSDSLIVTARTDNGLIMALEHMTYPIYGVQFHPESIVTEHGMQMVKNFLAV